MGEIFMKYFESEGLAIMYVRMLNVKLISVQW